MPDSVTEATSQSWFSRIVDSIRSVLVGGAFFALSFPVLFWNEGRAVRTAKSLEEGAGAVASVSASPVDPSNEGKLVHMAGEAATAEAVSDPDFGVVASAVKLVRTAEMYQWKEDKRSETRKKLGGGTETVTAYSYEKTWAPEPIDSSDFKEPEGHTNPEAMPVSSQTVVAKEVTVGAFTLSEAQVAMIGNTQDLRLEAGAISSLPGAMAGKARVHDGKFYMGGDPSAPTLGDVRVSFKVVKPGPVSLVARQVGRTFEPYQAAAGGSILLLEEGTRSAESMFKAARTANVTLTWILRGLGFFLMFLGLVMVFRPLAVVGDVVPLVGSLLGVGIGIFAFLVSVFLASVTIAASWFAVLPLLGIALLLPSAAAAAGLVALARRRARTGALPSTP